MPSILLTNALKHAIGSPVNNGHHRLFILFKQVDKEIGLSRRRKTSNASVKEMTSNRIGYCGFVATSVPKQLKL